MGAHSADGIKAVLSVAIDELEQQQRMVNLAKDNLDVTIGKLEALGEWDQSISDSVIALKNGVPKDIQETSDKYTRALNTLKQVYGAI